MQDVSCHLVPACSGQKLHRTKSSLTPGLSSNLVLVRVSCQAESLSVRTQRDRKIKFAPQVLIKTTWTWSHSELLHSLFTLSHVSRSNTALCPHCGFRQRWQMFYFEGASALFGYLVEFMSSWSSAPEAKMPGRDRRRLRSPPPPSHQRRILCPWQAAWRSQVTAARHHGG